MVEQKSKKNNLKIVKYSFDGRHSLLKQRALNHIRVQGCGYLKCDNIFSYIPVYKLKISAVANYPNKVYCWDRTYGRLPLAFWGENYEITFVCYIYISIKNADCPELAKTHFQSSKHNIVFNEVFFQSIYINKSDTEIVVPQSSCLDVYISDRKSQDIISFNKLTKNSKDLMVNQLATKLWQMFHATPWNLGEFDLTIDEFNNIFRHRERKVFTAKTIEEAERAYQ